MSGLPSADFFIFLWLAILWNDTAAKLLWHQKIFGFDVDIFKKISY
jgi:hypothetical protein